MELIRGLKRWRAREEERERARDEGYKWIEDGPGNIERTTTTKMKETGGGEELKKPKKRRQEEG